MADEKYLDQEEQQTNTLITETDESDLAQVKYVKEEERIQANGSVEIEEEEGTLIGETDSESDNSFYSAWWLSALVAVIFVGALDWILTEVGQRIFWTEQLVYIGSLTLFFFIALVHAYYVCRKTSRNRDVYIINGLMAIAGGVLLSVGRFIGNTVFWTFFNIIAQPINALLLSIAASWIIIKFFNDRSTSKNKESKTDTEISFQAPPDPEAQADKESDKETLTQ